MTPRESFRAAVPLIKAALREDLSRRGDVTTREFLPAGLKLSGRIVSKAVGVICGVDIAKKVFRKAAPGSSVRILKKDGSRVRPGEVVMRVSGGRSLLTAERTALNFLQHLSGIATLTKEYVDKVHGLRPGIFDTRKTLPGWRDLEKYAVRCGGGFNHRMGLYDMVLLKDNHWNAGTNPTERIRQFRRRYRGVKIEIEAADLAQVRRALATRPELILLDNMGAPLLRRAIALIRREAPRTRIEISGGVDLKTVRSLARLGPDRISIGRLTHSAPALDLSLEIP